MTIAYHVAPADHEGALQSLYAQHGDEAYDMYATRWPESGNLAQYHAHYVNLYDSLDKAREHRDTHGGKILAVDLDAMTDDWIDIVIDKLEFTHPMVRDEIPAEYLSEVQA